MRILRARRTATFVYLLVRCRCGRRFGHRAERRFIVCLHCGRIAEAAGARWAAPAQWFRPPQSANSSRAPATPARAERKPSRSRPTSRSEMRPSLPA